MMVIRGTVTNNEDTDVGENVQTIFPADRCTWQQTNSTGEGYSISNALFFPGAGGGNSDLIITAAELGFIGKSGRFVPITN